jgi:hypothetical protein
MYPHMAALGMGVWEESEFRKKLELLFNPMRGGGGGGGGALCFYREIDWPKP